jgi:uncharacterized membrane protein
MKMIADFARTTLIGGVLVLLPVYLAVLLLLKALAGVMALVAPVTAQIPAGAQFRQLIAILIILAACFIAGIVVRTGPGGASSAASAATRPRKASFRPWWSSRTRSCRP